jgi:hypothetical protein
MCRLQTAMCHWPLSSTATKEVQGPKKSLERRIRGPSEPRSKCWCTFWLLSQKQVIRISWLYPQAIRASQARPPPASFKYTLHPMQRCQQGPGSVEITLQPLIRGQRPWIGQRNGCGDHFGLFCAPVRGQAAELDTRAGWSSRYSIALLSTWLRKPGRAGTTTTHPWQTGTGQEFI